MNGGGIETHAVLSGVRPYRALAQPLLVRAERVPYADGARTSVDVLAGSPPRPVGPFLRDAAGWLIPAHVDAAAARALLEGPVVAQLERDGGVVALAPVTALSAAAPFAVVPGLSPLADELGLTALIDALLPVLAGRAVAERRAAAFPFLSERAHARVVAVSHDRAEVMAARALFDAMPPAGGAAELDVWFGLGAEPVDLARDCVVIAGGAELDALEDRAAAHGRAVRRLSVVSYGAPYATFAVAGARGDAGALIVTAAPAPPPRAAAAPRAAPALRVLWVRRPGGLAVRLGGVEGVTSALARELGALGVQVDNVDDPQPDARGYDVAHLWRGGDDAVVLAQAQRLAAAGVPVVLTPTHADWVGYAWFYRAAQWAFADPREATIDQRLALVRDRGVTLDGMSVDAPDPRNVAAMRATARVVSGYAVHSYGELREVWRHFGALRPYAVVPNGVDPAVMRPDAPPPFAGDRPYVLWTGRFEVQKNLLATLYALRDCDADLLVVGSVDLGVGGAFPALLRALAGPRVRFLPETHDRAFLASLYAHAAAVLVPSWTEVFSLTATEAVACGAPLVLGLGGYHAEAFGDVPYYVDPADAWAIRTAVERARNERASRAAERLALSERVRAERDWAHAAAALARFYRGLAGA